MAAEGYFLQTIGTNFCNFEKGEPQTLSYRIEIAEDGKDLSLKQHEKYTRDIWTTVASYNKFHVFSCPYEFVSPEPNPYPEELAKTLKPILWKNLMFLFVIILGTLAAIKLFPYFMNDLFILKTLRGSTVDLASWLIILYGVFAIIREIYFQGRLIIHLSRGIPIDHKAAWKKAYWLSYGLWGGRNLLIMVLLLSTFMVLFQAETPLSEASSTLPIVRLEAIQTADGSSFDTSKLKDSTYTKGFSLIAPLQYSSTEYADISLDKVLILDTATYKLAIPSMDEFIVNALVKDYEKFYSEIYKDKLTFPDPVSNEDFDILVVRDNGYRNEIFAAKNGLVVHLSYAGDKNTEALIKAASEIFNNPED